MKVNVFTATGGMLDLLVAWAKLGHQQRINALNSGRPLGWSDSDILQWALENKPSEKTMEDRVNNTLMAEVLQSKSGYKIQINGNRPGIDTVIDMSKDGAVLERYVGSTHTEAWMRCYVFMRVGDTTVDLPDYFTGRIPT